MRPDTSELIWGALRRSGWIMLVLMVVGVVAMNYTRQSQGPLYTASAGVILSPTDLAASVAGSGYVDPERVDAAEQALAESPGLYERAAAEANGVLGTGAELRAATTAALSGSSVTFSTQSPDGDRAEGIVNAVADVYPEWRLEVSGRAIENAIRELREQMKTNSDPALTDQMTRLNTLQTLTSGNVLLVEPTEGAIKTRPNPFRDTIVGVLIGLLGGLVAMGIREAVDTRVRTEAEVEELLDAPVIGTVERLPMRRGGVVALDRHSERFGDVYGLLAATIAGRAGDADGGTVIAITSATANEGKTTTAANLAAALAKRNADVILVDLDTRKPSLGKLFGVPTTALGAVQVLEEELAATKALHPISLSGRAGTGTSGSVAVRERDSDSGDAGSLRLLPGSRSSHDGVIPHRAHLNDLAVELRGQADFVIIDTPPALATADASEIAKIADMVLIVVRQGRPSRRGLTELGRLIRTWPPLVAVNAVLVDTVGREYYAYYPTR